MEKEAFAVLTLLDYDTLNFFNSHTSCNTPAFWLRMGRYVGLAQTHLQHVLMGTAINFTQ